MSSIKPDTANLQQSRSAFVHCIYHLLKSTKATMAWWKDKVNGAS